jgi:ketosteroid isomerase-like protein
VASWSEFEKAAPEFGAAGRRLLIGMDGVAIGFLASVGARGAPHLAPVCPIFCGAHLYLSAGAHTPKAADLRSSGNYVLHAFLAADDEEFQVAGRALEVHDQTECAAVHAAIPFAAFKTTDPIFRLSIERALWVCWERVGQPETQPVRRRWPPTEGLPTGCSGRSAAPPAARLERGVDLETKFQVSVEAEIQAMVDRETAAWDRQDAGALVALFHPDMVWPWPPDGQAHDPALWVFPQGRFDRERWKSGWEELFRTHELVHNRRRTVRIEVSAEADGAFAVVDVDTMWRRRADGELVHWRGRACKGYSKVGDAWLLIFHTGLLGYEGR